MLEDDLSSCEDDSPILPALKADDYTPVAIDRNPVQREQTILPSQTIRPVLHDLEDDQTSRADASSRLDPWNQ